MAKPQQYNNPFALIDKTPDKWLGLKGVDSSGFLIFDTVQHGLRAGFINLKNGYFKPNHDATTTRDIFVRYLGVPWGSSRGSDNPMQYADSVQKYQNIAPSDVVRWNDKEQMIKLAKGIIQVEEGKLWVPDADIRNAYDEANGGVSGIIDNAKEFILRTDGNEEILLLVSAVVIAGVTVYLLTKK